MKKVSQCEKKARELCGSTRLFGDKCLEDVGEHSICEKIHRAGLCHEDVIHTGQN